MVCSGCSHYWLHFDNIMSLDNLETETVVQFARQVGAQSPEVGGPANVNDPSQQQQQAGLHLGREHQAMAVEEPWQLIQEERVVRDAENQTVAGTLTSNVEAPPPAGGSSRARKAPRTKR